MVGREVRLCKRDPLDHERPFDEPIAQAGPRKETVQGFFRGERASEGPRLLLLEEIGWRDHIPPGAYSNIPQRLRQALRREIEAELLLRRLRVCRRGAGDQQERKYCRRGG